MAHDKGSDTLTPTPGRREQARKPTQDTLRDNVELSIVELEERIMPGYHTP